MVNVVWGLIRSWHIRRIAPFDSQSLCGRRWSKVTETRDAGHQWDPGEPTCETCLRIAARSGVDVARG